MTLVGPSERRLRHGVVEHAGPDRVTLGVVGVEQALGCGPLHHLGQLPPEVHGILHAHVEALATLRRVHVGGVTGQQDASLAVRGRLPRHVGEPGDPGGAPQPVVGPVDGDECLPDVVDGGLVGVLDLRFGQGEAHRRPVFRRADAAAPAQAELRLLVQLDLGDDPAGRSRQPGEVDAGGLADEAATSIAPHQVRRADRRVVGQVDVDAGVVLREAHHLATTKGRDAELGDPVGQDALDVPLPEPEHVVVAGREVGDVHHDQAEAQARVLLPLRDEPLRDAPLVEHLEGAAVEAPGTRSLDLLGGASFDDGDVDPGQRQLARQHHPGRAASRDHHRMVRQDRHSTTPGCRGTGRDRLSEE